MRLISLTVKNYRAHREQRVEFDAERTLIGGPNESGKSTLMEAAHRALFLKAKGKTELHQSMNSITHPGHPEVELEFSLHDQRYHIHKIFSGAKGVTKLTQSGGKTWQDIEAEETLATQLGTEPVGGSGAHKIRALWAHLWIWQGDSGADPVQHANAERSTLMQRLQTHGGAAVMQSELDARVIELISTQVNELFTLAGEARANTELSRAKTAEKEALEAESNAHTTLAKLQQTVRDHEQATGDLAAAEKTLAGINVQQQELETRHTAASRLQREQEDQIRHLNDAQRIHETQVNAHRSLLGLQTKLSDLRTHQSPRQAELERLQAAENQARGEVESAEQQARTAEETLHSIRAQHDLYQAQKLLKVKQADQTRLLDRAEKLRTLRKNAASFEKDLAALPLVDATVLRALQSREREAANAQATLKGMATGLEILSSDLTVLLNGTKIPAGKAVIVTEDSDIQIGGGTQLRIRPGGGTSLAEARRMADEAQHALQQSLQKIGIQTFAEAATIQTQRLQLQSQLKALQAEMSGLGADSLQAELQAMERDLAAAAAEVERRLAALPHNDSQPAHAPEDLRKAEARHQTARSQREAVLKRHKEAIANLSQLQESCRQAEEDIRTLELRLTLLTEQHGTEAQRSSALQAAQAEVATHQTKLQAIEKQLAELQPDQIMADRERLARVLQVQTAKRENALAQLTSAAVLLRQDGSFDPTAAVTLAKARTLSAQEQLAVIQRRTAALQLLHQLFQQEQQQLARGSRGALDFHTLSGGAREQVAAAFRLAMAEILAEAQDGHLPMIFDDAFAHSDPARVRALQRMLDLGAARGLQIIVLTCNPEDYTALGAREQLLTHHV
ncbi:MAG: AAA family ATPase [Verrucomicrobia bacterium]|nr:AAA family ATPase [Verrucomicrobiota bacterium]